MEKFHFHKYATIGQHDLPSGKNPGKKINVMITKRCIICNKETYLISDRNNQYAKSNVDVS